MNAVKKYVLLVWVVLIPVLAQAQCAMCRTQVVNNVSAGETSFAAGLNMGILYLFFTPYILIGIVAFMWFKHSKVSERKESIISRIKRQVP